MPIGHHAVHDFVVVVAGWWIVLEHDLAELVEDPKCEAVFDEERKDVLDGQTSLTFSSVLPMVFKMLARVITLRFLSALKRLSSYIS